MYYGVLGGLKTGARIGLWTGSFVGLQEGIEGGVRRMLPENRQHYKTRWASGAFAGLGLATAAGQICKSSPLERGMQLLMLTWTVFVLRSIVKVRCT
jgi:hypothetical protein